MGQWHWLLLLVPGVGGAVEVFLGLGWLAHLLCVLGMVFGSEHEHVCACLCFWGLFPECVMGGLVALVLGAFAALSLLIAGWGFPVSADCGSPWVLGVGRVTGAFFLWNRPCHHDINE